MLNEGSKKRRRHDETCSELCVYPRGNTPQLLFRTNIFFQNPHREVRPFALTPKRVAIRGEKFGFSKQPSRPGHDALMKFEDATQSLYEIFLRRTPANRFLQFLQRPEHVWQVFLEHCQKQF